MPIFKRAATSLQRAASAGKTVLAAFGVVSIVLLQGANAQAQDGSETLLLELNALQSNERGCRFTFLIGNHLGVGLDDVAFELALFTKAGMISRMTVIDFAELPEGKSKVRQFDFTGVDCADVGRVLVNTATRCNGLGIEAGTCIGRLTTETRTDTIFGR